MTSHEPAAGLRHSPGAAAPAGRPDAVERVYLQSDLGEERRARLADVLQKAVRVRAFRPTSSRGSRAPPSTRASPRWRSSRGRCRKAPPGTCWPASTSRWCWCSTACRTPAISAPACGRPTRPGRTCRGGAAPQCGRHARRQQGGCRCGRSPAHRAGQQPGPLPGTLKSQGLWIVGTDDAAGTPSTTWT